MCEWVNEWVEWMNEWLFVCVWHTLSTLNTILNLACAQCKPIVHSIIAIVNYCLQSARAKANENLGVPNSCVSVWNIEKKFGSPAILHRVSGSALYQILQFSEGRPKYFHPIKFQFFFNSSHGTKKDEMLKRGWGRAKALLTLSYFICIYLMDCVFNGVKDVEKGVSLCMGGGRRGRSR